MQVTGTPLSHANLPWRKPGIGTDRPAATRARWGCTWLGPR